MESPGNSNGQRTVSGSPGRAEQGVAGIPPGMDAHLSGAPCQSGCQGFVGQGLSAGSFQQGFLNSDPWANWLNQRQAQEFYNQQLLLQQQFRNAQSVPVPPSVSSTPGNQGPVYQGQGFGSVGRGDSVTQVTRMLQQLSPVELQSVLQSVGQVNPGFKSQDLGDLYDDVGLLPGSGVAGSSKGDSGSKDMFSRNEKWIGNPPTVNHKAWKSREDEILGWSVYLQELSSWASQGSVKFGREIELSSRWIEPIVWNRLSSEQQNRAVRLQALLSAAFAEHGRITLMVQGFQEGLDISPEFDSRASEPYGNRNGFELLRQLTKEFSLRNHAEALSLKTQLLARVFVPDPSSGSSQVSDVIRQIDLACARFMRMVGTLGAGMASGLQITDSDQLSLLVRSLPNDARSYALMHSSGESYQQYRISARRFENQHRLFKDLVPQRRAVVNLVEDFSHPKDESTTQELSQDFGGEGEEIVAGVSDGQGPRCMKCGSKRHDSSSCTTNLDKLKCFKCGQLGHASLNCRVKKSPDGKPFPSKGSGKSPQKGQKGGSNSSGKGSKGSSKGKKGKMFAVLDEDGSWWYTECAAEEESADAPQDGAEDENSGVLVLNCVLPQLDSLVVGDSLRHDCCSSDASSGADEENFDSDASLDANEESFDVDRLFDGVLHFDMAYDDFDEFEFEEMSPIRNVTDLETVYNRNWSTADWGDSRDVEASLERALCQQRVCARPAACPGVTLAEKRRAMACIRQLNRRAMIFVKT